MLSLWFVWATFHIALIQIISVCEIYVETSSIMLVRIYELRELFVWAFHIENKFIPLAFIIKLRFDSKKIVKLIRDLKEKKNSRKRSITKKDSCLNISELLFGWALKIFLSVFYLFFKLSHQKFNKLIKSSEWWVVINWSFLIISKELYGWISLNIISTTSFSLNSHINSSNINDTFENFCSFLYLWGRTLTMSTPWCYIKIFIP